MHRSPLLQTDGIPHPLEVSCELSDCSFAYDLAGMYDGDGNGFDLLLSDTEAGRAYALMIELPLGQTAAQVKATFYQANAAAGSTG